MAKIISIFLTTYVTIIITGCIEQKKKREPCLLSVKYVDNEKYFNPPSIKVDFIDVDTLIGESAKRAIFKEIIFNSSGKGTGKYFWLKPNYYSHQNDTTSLYFVLGDPDSIGIAKMSQQEIEAFLLKNGVEFIKREGDTLKVIPCE